MSKKRKYFFRQLITRLGKGNLTTIAIGLLIVLAGRFFILSLAAQIPQQQPGLIVHQVMSQNEMKESVQNFETTDEERGSLKPFDLLNAENSIRVNISDVSATDDYWNLDWWIRYLLREMSKDTEPFSFTDERVFIIYRDDGITPQEGIRTNRLTDEWLLSENQIMGSRFDRNWTLQSAWKPDVGLTYFRLDAPQYLHGELKADEAILAQAEKSAGYFRRQLMQWVKEVTSSDSVAPVNIPQKWFSAPSSFQMEGMICHVIYDNVDDGSRFIVFYNVATMQVTGFSTQ